MIVCNKCGRENIDEAILCVKCGHKLQSTRRDDAPGLARPPTLHPLGEEPLSRSLLPWLKHIESWAYVLALAVTAGVSMYFGDYRVLYVLVPLIAVVAWLRRL